MSYSISTCCSSDIFVMLIARIWILVEFGIWIPWNNQTFFERTIPGSTSVEGPQCFPGKRFCKRFIGEFWGFLNRSQLTNTGSAMGSLQRFSDVIGGQKLQRKLMIKWFWPVAASIITNRALMHCPNRRVFLLLCYLSSLPTLTTFL